MSIKSFAEAKAEKAQDSREWTPLDALEAALRDVKSGEINPTRLVISFVSDNPDGTQSYHYYCSNVNRFEHIGLLQLGIQNALDEWRA